MSMQDPIADFLTRLRNACAARHASTDVSHSSIKEQLARILAEEGYIGAWSIVGDAPKRTITMELKYAVDGKPVIRGIKRISSPGRRHYRGADDVPRVLNGLGISIISTSRGVLTDVAARSQHVGGEILCSVW